MAGRRFGELETCFGQTCQRILGGVLERVVEPDYVLAMHYHPLAHMMRLEISAAAFEGGQFHIGR
jgi:hypothetical protein